MLPAPRAQLTNTAPELLLDRAGITCPGNSTLDRAAAYASVRRSPRWEHVRELATDPYFSIHHAALKRYASRQPPRFVANDEVVIILMASEQRAGRARAQRETWLRNYPHLFIVGDAADPSVPMITLPELEGRTTYADAQHRQLRYMRFLYEHRPELLDKRYFFLVGALLRRSCRCASWRTGHRSTIAWQRGKADRYNARVQLLHALWRGLHGASLQPRLHSTSVDSARAARAGPVLPAQGKAMRPGSLVGWGMLHEVASVQAGAFFNLQK